LPEQVPFHISKQDGMWFANASQDPAMNISVANLGRQPVAASALRIRSQ
jgi:hypothetical protein